MSFVFAAVFLVVYYYAILLLRSPGVESSSFSFFPWDAATIMKDGKLYNVLYRIFVSDCCRDVKDFKRGTGNLKFSIKLDGDD